MAEILHLLSILHSSCQQHHVATIQTHSLCAHFTARVSTNEKERKRLYVHGQISEYSMLFEWFNGYGQYDGKEILMVPCNLTQGKGKDNYFIHHMIICLILIDYDIYSLIGWSVMAKNGNEFCEISSMKACHY